MLNVILFCTDYTYENNTYLLLYFEVLIVDCTNKIQFKIGVLQAGLVHKNMVELVRIYVYISEKLYVNSIIL